VKEPNRKAILKSDPNSHCLFILGDHPISPNAVGGGGVVFYNHIELLANCGYKIDLVVLSDFDHPVVFKNYMHTQPEIWDRVNGWCISCHFIQIHRIIRQSAPLKHLWLLLKDPVSYFFPVSQETISNLQKVILNVNPNLIWAEHLSPALLALKSTNDFPIIYSHHDWEWLIGWHRRNAENRNIFKSIFSTWLTKRIEDNLVRQVSGCVSASSTEKDQIMKLGAKNSAYFPTTYFPVEQLFDPMPLNNSARIVHLGGMKTTANRVGLQRFLDITWPLICKNLMSPPELWVIGTLEGASVSLLNKIKQAGAVCTGFVYDLSPVLRPYDIHIIPWEHNTGTRTRIPLALNYSQVLVSTKTAAACLPELANGIDCILVDDLYSMGKEILVLLSDQTRRKRIGQEGRNTFKENFVRDAIQPRFNKFINNVVGGVGKKIRSVT
jgi:glycosyltransferase involved in cell wall biosynthesis